MVYAFSGALFAAALAASFLVSSHSEFLLVRFLLLFWSHAWPLVLTLGLIVWAGAGTSTRLVAGYFLVYGRGTPILTGLGKSWIPAFRRNGAPKTAGILVGGSAFFRPTIPPAFPADKA